MSAAGRSGRARAGGALVAGRRAIQGAGHRYGTATSGPRPTAIGPRAARRLGRTRGPASPAAGKHEHDLRPNPIFACKEARS